MFHRRNIVNNLEKEDIYINEKVFSKQGNYAIYIWTKITNTIADIVHLAICSSYSKKIRNKYMIKKIIVTLGDERKTIKVKPNIYDQENCDEKLAQILGNSYYPFEIEVIYKVFGVKNKIRRIYFYSIKEV